MMSTPVRIFEPPTPPSDIVATRFMSEMKYRSRSGKVRIVRTYNAYSIDDVVANMGKAFMTGLLKGTGYERPETPRKLKTVLSRVDLVY